MKIISTNKILISLVLFVFNNPVFGQKSKLVPCQKGWTYCFCDSTGKVVLNGKWEYVSKFNNGFAFVRNKKRLGYIDSTGKYESNCHFSEMGRFHNGYAWGSNKTGEIDIINKKCEIKFSKTHTWGEHGAAFFDSLIVIYALNDMNECGNTEDSYGAIDYNFNIVIPFNYEGMIKSSSDRYYFVSKSALKKDEGNCPTLWGIYDIVERKETVPCSYSEKLVTENGVGTYTFGDDFLKELEKLKLSVPLKDEISDQINGIFNW